MTSHNIIIVHNQLIRFPDIAFFVSPIPLHIAAMVILYGHMSRCDRITRQVALEDVWMALDMLPSLRWRWERKDLNGGHPLIAKVAEKVLEVNLHQVGPPSHPMLMSEQDWGQDAENMASAGVQQQQKHQTTPKMAINYSAGGGYSNQSTLNPQGQPQQLADVPAGLFYPFYPEKVNPVPSDHVGGLVMDTGSGSPESGHGSGEFNNLLAAAGADHQLSNYGYHPSTDSYMLEEKDTVAVHPGMQMWMNNAVAVSLQ